MEFVTVCTSLNIAEADLIQGKLESAGFTVNIKNEELALGVETGRGVLIQVPADKAEEARELLQYQAPPPA